MSGFVLLGLGLAAVITGAILLVSNKVTSSGISGAMSGITTFLGGGFVLGGLAALGMGSLLLASGRGAPRGAPGAPRSYTLVPGVMLLLTAILLGVAGLLGSQTWVMVPGLLAGIGGVLVFVRSSRLRKPS